MKKLGAVAEISAQTPPVKNPTALTFTSVDHNNTSVTGYEVDILNGVSVIQTLNIGKSATSAVLLNR